MPAAISYILDNTSPDYRTLEEAHANEYDSRAAAFALRWAYYRGEMRKPLALQADGVDDNILLPKVDQVVDKVISFLYGDGIEFDASSGDENAESDPTDELLATIWRESRGADTQHRLGMHGAISGHCFARVEPREGEPPKIVALNPAHCSAFWDATDQTRVLWYRLQHRLGVSGAGKRIDYVRGSALAPDGPDDAWYEMVYTIPTNGQHWKPAAEPKRLDVCPIVDWQNLPNSVDYYGLDDASKAVALNDALNFAASNLQRILKHYGSPKTIGLGFTVEEDVKAGAGDLVTISKPPSEADVKYLEMTGDLTAVREWIATLEREIWESARMVDPQSIRDKIGQATNFVMRVLYGDAIKKTETKRGLYGEAFEKIGKLALTFAGAAVPERIATVWPDPLPTDDAAVAAVLQQDLAVKAISLQTYREARGYDNEREEQRIDDESDGQDDLGTRLLSAFERGGNVQPMRRRRGVSGATS